MVRLFPLSINIEIYKSCNDNPKVKAVFTRDLLKCKWKLSSCGESVGNFKNLKRGSYQLRNTEKDKTISDDDPMDILGGVISSRKPQISLTVVEETRRKNKLIEVCGCVCE